jgi:membrane protein YdbS with pleckstrin-like domain
MTFPTRLLAPGEEVYLDSLPNWSYLFWPAVLTVLVLAGCVAVVVLWGSAPIWVGWVLLGIGLCAVAYFGARYVVYRTTSFVVTSQRIVYRTGAVRRTGREIPIGRVQDVTYHQTVVERIVRAGSLTVESAGRQGRDPFPDISRPEEVQSLINRVVAQAAGAYGFEQSSGLAPIGRPATPPPAVGLPVAGAEPTTDPTPRTTLPTAPADPPQPQPPTATDAPQASPPPTATYAPPPPPPAPTIAQKLEQLAQLHQHGVITDAEYEQKRRQFLDQL